MEIVTFVIDGRAEVGPSETKEVDSLACVELNKKADEMASTMEREIRRLMLPAGGITVQADLWFRPGASVIIEGSVILLCWVGRTALEPIRDELANAIKTVTRRVLNRAVSALSNLPPLANLRLDAPTIDVASLPPTRLDTSLASTPTPPTQQAAGPTLQDQRWLIVALGILGVLVLILLADRILSASFPRNVYVLPTSALTGVTSTPTAPAPAQAPK